MALHRVGILTGGGDAPGLNAVLRAFIKRAVGQLHWQVVGIEDSFDGMLEQPMRVHELTAPKCRGLLTRGGTFLGTTNRGDPFNYRGQGDIAARVPEAMKELGLETSLGEIIEKQQTSRGHFSEALPAFESALEFQPDRAEILLGLATVHHALHNQAERDRYHAAWKNARGR